MINDTQKVNLVIMGEDSWGDPYVQMPLDYYKKLCDQANLCEHYLLQNIRIKNELQDLQFKIDAFSIEGSNN